MKKIINYFLQGLLYIVPIAVTFIIVFKIFTILDEILYPIIQIHGLSFIVLIFLIIITGFISTKIITSPINAFFQRLLAKAPLLKTIYSSVKDLLKTFAGKKKGFEKAVLIKLYENSTIERIGFITNEDLNSLGIKGGKILVYLPHSYAFSGQLFVVDRSYVTPIDQSSSEIMKLIVSGGITEMEN